MKRLSAALTGGLMALLVATGCAVGTSPSIPPPPPAPKAEATVAKPAAPTATAVAATPKPAASPTAAPAAAKPAAEAPKPAAPAKLETIKMGTLGSGSDAPLYIGKERGYFQQEGLNAEIIPFTAIPMMTAPLASGEIDAGAGTLAVSTFNALERGIKIKSVADKSSMNDRFKYGTVLLRKDLADSGAVKQAKDLKGAKIGIPCTKCGNEIRIWLILEQGGLTLNDVEILELGYPEVVTALANKAITAGFLIEPSQTAAIERGVAAMWEPGFFWRYMGGVTQGATVTYGERLLNNVDLGRKFMVAYLKGVRDYNDAFLKGKNKTEIVSILTKNTNVKDPAMYDKMHMTYINPDGAVDINSMKIDMGFYRKLGYYTGKVEIDDLVDNSFVEYAVQKLGKYQ